MKYQLIKERDPLLSPIEQIFYNRGISLQEIQNFIVAGCCAQKEKLEIQHHLEVG